MFEVIRRDLLIIDPISERSENAGSQLLGFLRVGAKTGMNSGESGEGGIRTRGGDLGPHAALAKRCFRPLSHLSKPLLINGIESIPCWLLQPSTTAPGRTRAGVFEYPGRGHNAPLKGAVVMLQPHSTASAPAGKPAKPYLEFPLTAHPSGFPTTS
jgi:hypothetical protein